MRTDYLRYFIDVVTLGSMNSAAKKNFMSPQGISRSIAALETELGCELFQRDSNKVTLTRFGEQLLHDSRALLEHENNMHRTVLALQGEELHTRKMRFACYANPLFFETPLLYPVSGFSTAHYGNVRFQQLGNASIIAALVQAARTHYADIITAGGLAFYSTFAKENVLAIQELLNHGYEYYPLLQTWDFVLVPAYTPLARADKITREQLRAHRIAVSNAGDMERVAAEILGSTGMLYATAGDSAYRRHLCRTGEALTFVPGTSLVFDIPEGTAPVAFEQPQHIEIGFAAQPDVLQKSLLTDIIERLRKFYGKYQRDDYYIMLDGHRKSSLFVY